MSHLGILDDMDHEAKYDTDVEYRKSELRIQALGAAISRRDWHAVEHAHAAIRDKFYSHGPRAALSAPASPPAPGGVRKIVQIAVVPGWMGAVADDGTAWSMRTSEGGWVQIVELPGKDEVPPPVPTIAGSDEPAGGE